MSQRQDGPFASSVQWQTLNVGVQILIQLSFIRVLGEYLTEVEWGLLGLVLSCAGLVEIFAQLGVGPSLIQRQDLSRQQVSAAFWFSMLLGLGFALGFALGAPTIAGWFHRPDMEPVLEWAALSFLLAAFALVPRSLLIRRMDFRSLFWSSLVAMLLANAVFGIWAATAGWGVYAYIGALLLQNGLLGLQYWWRSGLRVDWRPHLSAARGLLRYGASSTVFNFLNYAATKLDLLVLGRLLPEARSPEQGLYDRSVYLMNTPVTVLGKLSDSVLFSGMSQVQDKRERLQRIFYGGSYIVTLLVLPGVVLLEVLMEDVVRILVSTQLLDIVPIARILVLAILFRSWVKICDAVVRAVDAILPASLIKAGFCLLVGGAAWVGFQRGLASMALAMVTATTLQAMALLWLTRHHIQFSTRRFLQMSIPGLVAGGLALIGTLPCLMLSEGTPWGWHFLLGIAGVGLMLAFGAWMAPQAFRVGEFNLLGSLAQRTGSTALIRRWTSAEDTPPAP